MILFIKGIKFTVKLLSPKAYIKLHEDKSKAVTGVHFIHFRKDFFTKSIIRHELNHAFVFSCLVDDATLNPGQIEELTCTIDEYHYRDKIKLVNLIYKKFKRCIK